MKNVTITVDEEVLGWAKIWAAKQGSSVSKLLGQLLREKMKSERSYTAAMKRDLARAPTPLKAAASGYPSRESLHER